MQLNRLTRLPRNDVIKLPSEILTREREVLCEDHLTQYVLTISTFDALLVQIGESPVNTLWLLSDNFVQHGDELEELGSHLVNFHGESIRQLL